MTRRLESVFSLKLCFIGLAEGIASID